MSNRSPTTLYIVAAPEDRRLRDRLLRHLSPLTSEAIVCILPDPLPGERIDDVAPTLAQADIVLVLLSADFLGSSTLPSTTMNALMARMASGRVVIPVRLRHCIYSNTPFASLRTLPLDGEPITTWPDIDEALTDVAQSIAVVARRISFDHRNLQGRVKPLQDSVDVLNAHLPPSREVPFEMEGLRAAGQGDIIGGYRLLRHLESTGYWEVWHVSDKSEKIRTLKVPSSTTLGQQRARIEIRAAASVQSLFVHQLVEVLRLEPAARHCLVYEGLLGDSLSTTLCKRRTLSLAELHPIVEDVLEGLFAVHRAGIVHRVLSPADIFLDTIAAAEPPLERVQRLQMGKLRVNIGRPRAKLLNFGADHILRITPFERTVTAEHDCALFDQLDSVRRCHVAPEVTFDIEVDERADLYSVASVVFTALTGAPPVPQLKSDLEWISSKHFLRDPPSLESATGTKWSPALERLVSTGLAPVPEDRFSSANEMLLMWRSILG